MHFGEEPAFCCCEFVDRHGERAHLSDCAACDDCILACCSCSPLAAERVLSDVDDRMRLPQYNGAVHIGLEGLAPAVAIPLLGWVAARSAPLAALLLLLVPAALLCLHHAAVRRRRRSRFFVGWTVCSWVYGNLIFTVHVGEHVPFGLWAAAAFLHVAVAACTSAARAPLRRHGESELGDAGAPLRPAPSDDDAGNDSGDAESASALPPTDDAEGQPEVEAPTVDGTARCALCGVWVPRYDHHCVWLDACVGAHNIHVFARGLLAFVAATSLQAALCAARFAQRRRHTGLEWGIEPVLTMYSLLVSAAAATLLATMALNRSRGLTAYQARRLKCRGMPLPAPSMRRLLACA